MRISDIGGVYERRGGRRGCRGGSALRPHPLVILSAAASTGGVFYDFGDTTRITKDGSERISSIFDRVSNDEAVQATDAQKPVWGATSPTGRRGATFAAASTRRLVGTTARLPDLLDGVTAYSCLWVATFSGFAAARAVWGVGDSGSSPNCIIDSANATTGLDNRARGDGSATTGNNGGAHGTSIVVSSTVFTGAAYSSWLDGTASVSSAANTRSIAVDTFVMGCRRLSGAYNAGMDGVIYALLVAPGIQWTTAQRQSYEAAARRYWVTG